MTKITKPNKSQGSARACFYMYVLCADLCLLSAEVGRRCHAQGPACTWGTYSVVSYNLVFSKKKKLYIHDFFFKERLGEAVTFQVCSMLIYFLSRTKGA